MGGQARPPSKQARAQNTSMTMEELNKLSDDYEFNEAPEIVAERKRLKIEADAKQFEVDKTKELATTQAAIYSGAEAAKAQSKARRKTGGSLMTSGAADSSIGYGPIGNRRTLLGF